MRSPVNPAVWSRVLVSAAVLAAVVAGGMLPLPGQVADPSAFESKRPMTILAVGSSPFFWAMVLVEVAAALVPGWRRLREDGAVGRRRLWRVALGIGLVFAALQSVASIRFQVVTWLVAGDLATFSTEWPAPALMLILFGGSLFTLLAARVASEAGLGAGFAVVFLGGLIAQCWRWVLLLERLRIEIPPFSWVFQALWVVAVVAFFRLVDRPARGAAAAAERPHRLPFPVAGVLPMLVAFGIVFEALPLLESLSKLLNDRPYLRAALEAAISVNVAIAVAVWCHRPSRVGAAWARWIAAPGVPPDLQRAQVAARVRALLPTAITWNGALIAVWFVPPMLLDVTVLFELADLVIGVSIVLDLVEEVRARAAGGQLVTAWTLARPYEVEPALEALAAAGIRARARGLHARATQQLWGVLLPIHVLVPPDQVEKARAVLTQPPS